MKARINTETKVIAIDEPIAIDELMKFVKALFPDDWKAWKVDTNVKIEMTSTPIIVDRWPSHPWPYYFTSSPNKFELDVSTDPFPPITTFCLQTEN